MQDVSSVRLMASGSGVMLSALSTRLACQPVVDGLTSDGCGGCGDYAGEQL